MVAAKIRMVIGFEDLGSALGQADGWDDKGCFSSPMRVSAPMMSTIVFPERAGVVFRGEKGAQHVGHFAEGCVWPPTVGEDAGPVTLECVLNPGGGNLARYADCDNAADRRARDQVEPSRHRRTDPGLQVSEDGDGVEAKISTAAEPEDLEPQ
jgi:hypothetical protein